MSLKQFLVVSKSFIGIRNSKSPYELKKENLLPRFSSSPRFTSAASHQLVQGDWISEPNPSFAHPAKPAEPAIQNVISPAVEASPIQHSAEETAVTPRVKRKWYFWLTFGFFGRSQVSSALVQAELSLDRISVVRNDLADSDIELVIKRKKKPRSSPLESAERSTSESSHQPWSRLTARLFEIGQEQ